MSMIWGYQKSNDKHIVVPQLKKKNNFTKIDKMIKKLYAEEAKINSIEIKKNSNHV